MRESRFIGTIMSILGWFTIPAEVILRRRFGYRWFTPMNFYAGVALLIGLDYLLLWIGNVRIWISSLNTVWNPFYSSEPVNDLGSLSFMHNCVYLYVILGVHQLFMRWWRNRTGYELHSYDDGTSRLEFLGGILKAIINAITEPLMSMLFYISRAHKRGGTVPEVIKDRTSFTNTIIEPAVIYTAAVLCPYTYPKIWLLITAFAVAIYANMKESAKRTRVLDFEDSRLEAKAMAALRKGEVDKGKKPEAPTSKGKVEPKEPAKPVPEKLPVYPALKTIIAELHMDRNHLAN